MWKIRAASDRDAAAILQIYAPYVRNTTVTFEYDVPSLSAFTQRMQTVQAVYPWLVCEQDGILVGYAYLARIFSRTAYDWDAEPSIYLAPVAQRHGLGTAFYTALEEIARRMRIQLLYALITTENEGSCRFHEQLGYRKAWCMERCGFKHGRWLGVNWYEKRLFLADPEPIVPVSSLPEHEIAVILQHAEQMIR